MGIQYTKTQRTEDFSWQTEKESHLWGIAGQVNDLGFRVWDFHEGERGGEMYLTAARSLKKFQIPTITSVPQAVWHQV